MRLIDADALMKMLKHHEKDCNPDHFDGHETFIDKIDAQDSYGEWQFANGFNLGIVASIVDTKSVPTIDAEPVVRCKDCVYCKRFNDVWRLPKSDELLCTLYVETYHTTENDYCSRGERR